MTNRNKKSKWDSYTPQKFLDLTDRKISKLVNSFSKASELELSDDNGLSPFDKLGFGFVYSFYDAFPLKYLISKSEVLGISIPTKVKGNDYSTASRVKKDIIIEKLTKKKWRISGYNKSSSSINKNESLNTLRMEILARYLNHHKRLVRKRAALSISEEENYHDFFIAFLTNENVRKAYTKALEESLPHVTSDLEKVLPALFLPEMRRVSAHIIANVVQKGTNQIVSRLNKVNSVDWSQYSSSEKSSEFVINGNYTKQSEKVLSFKAWLEKNKGKSFSEYKNEVFP